MSLSRGSRTVRRAASGLGVGVLLVVAASGCSSPDPVKKGPYFDEVVAASKAAKSDFERTVLSDGVITRAEYEESVQKLVACAEARGVTIAPERQGAMYVYSMRTSAISDTVMTQCSVGTTQVIESLYSAMTRNPTKGDEDALVAACLARSGLAKPGYNKTQYLAERNAQTRGHVLIPKWSFDGDDPRLPECEGNPASH